MADAPNVVTGGCFCGAIRYEIAGVPRGAAHCHCSMCRRISGAPMVTWASYPGDAYRVTKGAPATLRSSAAATRTFCGTCGTPLTFHTADHPQWIDVTVCSMDHPEAMPPQAHVWVESHLPWLDLADGLPQLPRGVPD